MAVPAVITDLSTTAASNPPAGTDDVLPDLDNHIRAAYAFIRQVYDGKLALTGGTLTGALTISSGNLTLSTGNVGVGVALSSWGSGINVLELKSSGIGLSAYSAANTVYSCNTYYDGTNWKYGTSNQASYYQQNVGTHRFYVASSGTAGNNITWTNALYIDNSANVGIGTTSPNAKLAVMTSLQGIEVAPSATPVIQSYDRNASAYLPMRLDFSTFFARQGGSTNSLHIDASSNVMLGTATQHWSDKLTVGSSAGGSVGALNTCKAWVRFDGTAGSPTVAAGYNVASITKNATGDYTITFTNAMADTNYSFAITGSSLSSPANAGNARIGFPVAVATGSFRFGITDNNADTLFDAGAISVQIYGN